MMWIGIFFSILEDMLGAVLSFSMFRNIIWMKLDSLKVFSLKTITYMILAELDSLLNLVFSKTIK